MSAGAYYNEIDPFAAAWLRELIAADLIAPGDVDERSIEDVLATDLVGGDGMTALMVTLDLRIGAARRVYGAAGNILMRLCPGCVLVDDCGVRDRFIESGRDAAIVGWIEYDRWFRGDKCPEAIECRARITARDLADYRAEKRDRTFRPCECRQQLRLFLEDSP